MGHRGAAPAANHTGDEQDVWTRLPANASVKEIATAALRHRILLNFEGEAEHVDTDDILKEILEDTPFSTD